MEAVEDVADECHDTKHILGHGGCLLSLSMKNVQLTTVYLVMAQIISIASLFSPSIIGEGCKIFCLFEDLLSWANFCVYLAS